MVCHPTVGNCHQHPAPGPNQLSQCLGSGARVLWTGTALVPFQWLQHRWAVPVLEQMARGTHYFSALCLLLGAGEALFASPLIFKLHDGIESVPGDGPTTVVEKMAAVCVQLMEEGSYAVLDAYYASVKVLKPFREQGLHLITRMKISTVAHAAFSRRPGKHGPGRHRKWGSEIKLRELFAPLQQCERASVQLYGLPVTVYFQCFQFYWDSPDEPVLFVLTQWPSGQQMILLSSDLTLTGAQVIESYGWRFKIEVGFRTLVHLQVLALEMPRQVWSLFPLWFRTLPKHGFPSEQIVRLSLQHQLHFNLARSTPGLLLVKLLTAKMGVSPHSDEASLAA